MIVRRSTLIVECEQWILLFSVNVYLLSTAFLLDFTTVESVTLQAGSTQSRSQVPDNYTLRNEESKTDPATKCGNTILDVVFLALSFRHALRRVCCVLECFFI